MDPNAGFSENADGVSGLEMTQMGRLEGTIRFDGKWKQTCSALAKQTSLLTCVKKALSISTKIMTTSSDVPRFG
jgi:hypothetical protein